LPIGLNINYLKIHIIRDHDIIPFDGWENRPLDRMA
jgi:hypothetical protein